MSATIYTAINGDLRASRKSFPQQINRRYHSGTKIKKEKPYYRLLFDGVPEGIRTPDLTLRRGALYPAELLRRIQLVYDFTDISGFCQEISSSFNEQNKDIQLMDFVVGLWRRQDHVSAILAEG